MGRRHYTHFALAGTGPRPYNAAPSKVRDRNPSMFQHALNISATADVLSSTAVACVADMHGRTGGADPG